MKYLIVSPIEIPAGSVLSLTEGQAVPRRAVLKVIGAGIYEATAALSFKAGERIGYEGELPKAMAEKFEAADGSQAKSKSRKSAAKDSS